MTAGEKIPIITVSRTPGSSRGRITLLGWPPIAAKAAQSRQAAPRLAKSMYAPVISPLALPRGIHTLDATTSAPPRNGKPTASSVLYRPISRIPSKRSPLTLTLLFLVSFQDRAIDIPNLLCRCHFDFPPLHQVRQQPCHKVGCRAVQTLPQLGDHPVECRADSRIAHLVEQRHLFQ